MPGGVAAQRMLAASSTELGGTELFTVSTHGKKVGHESNRKKRRHISWVGEERHLGRTLAGIVHSRPGEWVFQTSRISARPR